MPRLLARRIRAVVSWRSGTEEPVLCRRSHWAGEAVESAKEAGLTESAGERGERLWRIFDPAIELPSGAQREGFRLVATLATIEMIRAATAVDDQYQLQRRQIAIGWLAKAADVNSDLLEFFYFCRRAN